MTNELSNFAARLREAILSFSDAGDDARSLQFQQLKTGTPNPNQSEPPHVGSYKIDFNRLALALFALQLKYNPAYRKICEARRVMPGAIDHWTEIPAVPTAVFKELDLTCLAPAERTAVFHSSGTTEQEPSRHFHNAESLAVYEASLWPWFKRHVLWSADSLSACSQTTITCGQAGRAPLVILTPSPEQAPHSSLVHMFETVRQKLGAPEASFVGKITADGSWVLDFNAAVGALSPGRQTPDPGPRLLLGTAFSFVHLLDHLVENNLWLRLPAGSRVMETGGYKNRSRTMPKAELHQLITEKLGIPPENIVCEYGMSELSSQAYDLGAPASRGQNFPDATMQLAVEMPALPGYVIRRFHFPPWARAQIISPETGRVVADGETGLIRIFDLANVFSVMAVQTEDLGIRRGEHFELIGRDQLAEPRGCSLMTVESRKS